MSRRGGRNVQNEPDLPAGSGPAVEGPGHDCAKQSQFRPLCRSGDRRSREGRLCETNPIWTSVAKPAGERCETKSIRPVEDVGRGRPTHEEPTMRDKARLGRPWGIWGTMSRVLYKQTQSGVPSREEGCRYEQTKPIGWRCQAGRGPVVQTNPIWERPGHEEGCRCEQTKPNLGDLGHLGNGVEGFVQTNPIGRDARCGLPPRASAGRLYKQTQFRPLCRSGDRRSQGPIVRNKANQNHRRSRWYEEGP
jgi:hypothetical protein